MLEYKRVKDRLVLTQPYSFEIEETVFSLPKNTSWNGADIPKIFRPFFGGALSAKNAEASLVHDWLIYVKWDYKQRDLYFYKILKKNRGVISSWCMYQGVRAYGHFYWKKR